jgi:Sec-independent protein secretion pathway component TatC
MDAPLPIGDRVIWVVAAVVAVFTVGRMVGWWVPLAALLLTGLYLVFWYADRKRDEGYGCYTDGLDDAQCRRWVAKHPA